MAPPRDAVPNALMRKVHDDTHRVRNDDENERFLGAVRNCVRNDGIEEDAHKSVRDGLNDRAAALFLVHVGLVYRKNRAGICRLMISIVPTKT